MYLEVEVKCFYRYDDFPYAVWEDAWAAVYLHAAQRLRTYLLRAGEASSAIPIDIDVLYGDGSRTTIPVRIQVPHVPACLQDWDCDVEGLGRASTDLHSAADPLYSPHQNRQTQLMVMGRGLTPEEQNQLDARRSDALRGILEATSCVRLTAAQQVDERERVQSILDEIDAYHRGVCD